MIKSRDGLVKDKFILSHTFIIASKFITYFDSVTIGQECKDNNLKHFATVTVIVQFKIILQN